MNITNTDIEDSDNQRAWTPPILIQERKLSLQNSKKALLEPNFQMKVKWTSEGQYSRQNPSSHQRTEELRQKWGTPTVHTPGEWGGGEALITGNDKGQTAHRASRTHNPGWSSNFTLWAPGRVWRNLIGTAIDDGPFRKTALAVRMTHWRKVTQEVRTII